MKTVYSFFTAAFLLFAASSFAQSQKSFIESANLTPCADGTACVQLTWKKGTENTAYYLVERSADGNEFKPVALVFTSEDEQFADYKYKDKTPATTGSALYYRVSIVNSQKELTYLPVQKVVLAGAVSALQKQAVDVLAAR